MLKELPERIEASIKPFKKTRVVNFPEKAHLGWIGGSIVGSLNTFETLPITKQEYAEIGELVVHIVC